MMLAGACGDETTGIEQDPDGVDKGDDDNADDDVGDDDVAADDDSTAADDDSTAADDDEPAPTPRDATVGRPDAARDTGVSQGGALDGGTPRTDGSTPRTDGGSAPPTADAGPVEMGDGMCCPDGKCLCHGPAPTALTAAKGPYATKSYTVPEGCIYYPDSADAKPPFAAVAFSHGFIGTGGCDPNSFQGGGWAPLYASWGIVGMTINTGGGDQPNVRAQKLLKGIAAFKSENMKSGSPLMGKLAGRYGTSGFSMGGGGTSLASVTDKTLLTSVAVMPWGPARSGVTTPTLIICGSSDGTAPCASHGNPLYRGIMGDVPKMRVQVSSGHQGQPSVDMGKSGKYGLAFQKVFLEGDTRWRPLLVAAPSEETNIK
jgi:hypothetical protein